MKNNKKIFALLLFFMILAIFLFGNEITLANALLKCFVASLLFTYLFYFVYDYDKKKLAQENLSNPNQLKNQLESDLLQNKSIHEYQFIIDKYIKGIISLNSDYEVGIYFIDSNQEEFHNHNNDFMLFKNKVSKKNEILSTALESNSRKIFKKNESDIDWNWLINKNEWTGAEIIISYPIIIKDKVVGCSLILSNHFKDISEHDLNYFDNLFDSYIHGIDFIEKFDELRYDQLYEKKLNELYQKYYNGISLDEIFDSIKGIVRLFFIYDRFTICLVNPKNNNVKIKFIDGFIDDFDKGFEFDHDSSIYGISIVKNQLVSSSQSDIQKKKNAGNQTKNFEIFLSSPLRSIGKAVGSITIERDDPIKLSKLEKEKLKRFAVVLSSIIKWRNDYLAIESVAMHDGLTGLLNHNAFLNRLEQEVDRSNRFQTNLGLIMLDLDKFKQINDTYGHLYGDYILEEVASIIKKNIRTIDVVGRYGGEEFSVILVNTNVRECIPLAERIVESIYKKTFIHDGIATNISISGGMSGYPLPANNSKELIKMADNALYLTKANGGNSVTIYQPEKI